MSLILEVVVSYKKVSVSFDVRRARLSDLSLAIFRSNLTSKAVTS